MENSEKMISLGKLYIYEFLKCILLQHLIKQLIY